MQFTIRINEPRHGRFAGNGDQRTQFLSERTTLNDILLCALAARAHLHGKFPSARPELSSANVELLRGYEKSRLLAKKENQYEADKSQVGTWQQASVYTVHTVRIHMYVYQPTYNIYKKYTFFGN